MNKNIIKAVPFRKQPIVFQQFCYKHKNRGLSAKSIFVFLLRKFINFLFSNTKNNTSFRVDKLIIGSNGIINLCLLDKINKKAISENKVIKVGILEPKEKDYWFYEILKEEETKKILKENIGYSTNNISELIYYIAKNNIFSNIEIFFIDNRYKIDYMEYDDFTKSWFLYFNNQKLTIPFSGEFIEEQNKFKEKINKDVKHLFFANKMAKQLIWDKVKKDKEFKTPILIMGDVLFSSLPQGWFDVKHEINEDGIVFYKYNNVINFFGTAKSICTKTEKLREHVLRDLESIELK